MRSSSLLLVILFLLTLFLLVDGLFLTPMIDGLCDYYVDQGIGHAVIPPEVQERWEKEGKPITPRAP